MFYICKLTRLFVGIYFNKDIIKDKDIIVYVPLFLTNPVVVFFPNKVQSISWFHCISESDRANMHPGKPL